MKYRILNFHYTALLHSSQVLPLATVLKLPLLYQNKYHHTAFTMNCYKEFRLCILRTR